MGKNMLEGFTYTLPYALSINAEPELVSFTNHNLTTLPRVANTPDPTYEWACHKPFDWKVKNNIESVRHPLSPFKIEPASSDAIHGYDSLCLRDYKCMINYINPENDIRK